MRSRDELTEQFRQAWVKLHPEWAGSPEFAPNISDVVEKFDELVTSLSKKQRAAAYSSLGRLFTSVIYD